jgi:NAD+ kinase
MNAAFETLALVGHNDDARVAESLAALAAHGLARGVRVLVDPSAAGSLPPAVERCPESEFHTRADLLVAVGGDGTLLHAAHLAVGHSVPILGINRGRLGFLADVTPENMLESLDEVLLGHYSRDLRTMLDATLSAPGSPDRTIRVLNDVVLQKWQTGRMLDFETWIDGAYVNTHGGDGLIVATATGSTAYALSCGGPIVQPDLDAVVMVPICPHTLSDRPIVVSRRSRIEIRLVAREGIQAQVTGDGKVLGEMHPQARIAIATAPEQLTLVHPPGHDHFHILRSKLHWGRGARRTDAES